MMDGKRDDDESLVPPGFQRHSFGGFEEHIGPLYCRNLDGIWYAGFVIEPKHRNPLGMVHGGMLASLADYLLSGIAFVAAGKKPCITLNLQCNYLAPATAGWIEGKGEVLRQSRSLLFLRGELYTSAGSIVYANGIWRITDVDVNNLTA